MPEFQSLLDDFLSFCNLFITDVMHFRSRCNAPLRGQSNFAKNRKRQAPLRVNAIFLTQNLTLLMQCSRKCVTSVCNKDFYFNKFLISSNA